VKLKRKINLAKGPKKSIKRMNIKIRKKDLFYGEIENKK
jgi:hypothetical protein